MRHHENFLKPAVVFILVAGAFLYLLYWVHVLVEELTKSMRIP